MRAELYWAIFATCFVKNLILVNFFVQVSVSRSMYVHVHLTSILNFASNFTRKYPSVCFDFFYKLL